jgi:NitT/TauT family transport system permease protein
MARRTDTSMRPSAISATRGPKGIVGPILLFVGVVSLWHLATTQGWVSELILPRPADVVPSTYELFASGLILEHLWATLYETVAGFALAAVVAITAATAAGSSAIVRSMVYPYAVALQVTPMIAIAPILVAALGFGFASKIAVAGLIAFFPIFVNTLTGLSSPEPDAEELFRSLRASRTKTFTNLLLPTAAPFIFAGLRVGLTLALAGAVVAEFLASTAGLGLLVQQFSSQLNMDDAFAVVVVLTGIGFLLFGAVSLADRHIVFWRHARGLTARTKRRGNRVRRKLVSGPAQSGRQPSHAQ